MITGEIFAKFRYSCTFIFCFFIFRSLELDPESDVTLFENVITSEKHSREVARMKLEGVSAKARSDFAG